ncbi:hypothetical protein YDYSG_55960 [Paenibacillus tyrfis]|uniref:hypothetical protein n=1 Tax=Paenibacillus tyrfis TaxID=1501230 RepID=UPI0024925F5F|nr:hypothetical protein [Paenibacillus tyrfis]GLI09564.1 hypothetical protein YDYSG_55960 [Paenibacillus tyrfis]
MKKKLITMTAIATIVAAIPIGASAAQPAIPTTNMVWQNEIGTFDVGDLLVDSGDTYISNQGYDEYSFDFTEADGNDLRVGYVGTSKQDVKVYIYYIPDPENNPNKRKKVATYEANRSNNYKFTKDIEGAEYGSYEARVVSGNGNGGEDYRFRIRGL